MWANAGQGSQEPGTGQSGGQSGGQICTAMGTTFSVTYATIFMIWLETPIINEFQQHILLYKRHIDYLFVVWSGSLVELSKFRTKFNKAN